MSNNRERLIELMQDWGTENTDSFPFESVADYLLANGVIVPPCKVGDTVYWISSKNKIRKVEIISILINVSETEYGCWGGDYTPICFHQSDFGKTVFLAKSQAEEALKNEQEKL